VIGRPRLCLLSMSYTCVRRFVVGVPAGILVCVLAAIAFLGTAAAQPTSSVTVEASAQPTEVGPTGTVTLTLRVEGASLSDVETPDAPRVENLVLQHRTPTTRQNVAYRDGVLRRHVTFEWRFRPEDQGRAAIHPVDVRVNGRDHPTAEIQVNVVSDPSRSRTTGSGGLSARWEAAQLDSESLFLGSRISDRQVYENQQLTVEYRLFFRPSVRLRRSRMAEAWDAPGFWREELDVAARPVPKTTTRRGQSYETIVLKRAALFPTRPGELRIDPLRIETEAQGADRGLRGRFERVTVSSEALTVEVEPLPSGAPSAFRGGVGQFSMDARIAEDSLAVGDGTDLQVDVRGTGNLPTLSSPVLEIPASFEVFGPDVDTDIDRGGRAVRGTKTFTYTLVPQERGRRVLPPLTFVYFDPEKRRYETLRSDPIPLNATGDAGPPAVGRTGNGFPVGDVAGLMTEAGRWMQSRKTPLYRQWWPYASVGLALLLGVGGVVYRRREEIEVREVEEPSPESPPDDIHARLEPARRCRRKADGRAFYETIGGLVRAALAERLDLPADASRSEIDERLAHSPVPDADREAVRMFFDTCDEALFGPDEPPASRQKELLDQTEALLRRIDTALPDASSRDA